MFKFNAFEVDEMVLLMITLFAAVKVNEVAAPEVFAIALLTVISPALVPAVPVVIVTLVPAFNKFWMSVFKILEVPVGV